MFDEPEDIVLNKRRRKKRQGTTIRDFMKILNVENSRSSSRNSYTEIINLQIFKLKCAWDPKEVLLEIFQSLINRLENYNGLPEKLALQWTNYYMDYPFFVPLRTRDQNSAESMAEAIMLLAKQSGGKFRIFKTVNQIKLYGLWGMKEKVKKIKSKNAKWRRRRRLFGGCSPKSPQLYFMAKKRGILPIYNDDNLCLFRSIVMGLAATFQEQSKFNSLYADPDKQKDLSIFLLKTVGIKHNLRSYNINHLAIIQKLFNSKYPGLILFICINAEKGFKVVYKGKSTARNNIFILLQGNHFDLILNMKKLMQTRGNFCPDCEAIVYKKSHNKNCVACCYLCYGYGADYPCKRGKEPPIHCSKCGFYFPNERCFQNHAKIGKKGGISICMERFFCPECNKVVYKRGKKHVCSNERVKECSTFFPCQNCSAIRSLTDEHHCYVQPLFFKLENEEEKGEKEDEAIRYIFFDIETCQDQKVLINGIRCRRQVPNLIICEIVCNKCSTDPEVLIPTGNKKFPNARKYAKDCCCGIWGKNFRFKKNQIDPANPRLLHFHTFEGGRTPSDQFLMFLTSQGSIEIKTIVLAHNGGKFDLHLLLSAIYRQNFAPSLTMTGLKIYRIYLGGSNRRRILFKDSINFIQGPLSRLFDTFGMQGTGVQKKPPFPHLWNRMENLNKPMDRLPPIQYYCPSQMKQMELAEFKQWYSANWRTPFELKSALIEYCSNDVQLLRIGCLKFKEIIQKISPNVDPFDLCSTIAGLAVTIWRAQFLRPNMMINLPESGLRPSHVQSNEARRFFYILSKITGKKIQTADSTKGEYSPDGMTFRVDGLIESNDGGPPIIIEYNGCRYHGCVKCYRDRKQILQGNRTAEDLFARSQMRKLELERRGYKVVEVWQCAVRQMLNKNSKLRKLWNRADLPPPPLHPRLNALRGGRVEPFRLYADSVTEPDTIIEHFDIVSMYPSVMKNGRYPLGSPNVYGKEDLDRLELPSLPWSLAKFPKGLHIKGFYLVRILPPKRMPLLSTKEMLPPFLPYRTKEHLLVFPLCSKCADKQLKKCRHSDEQRSWIDALVDEDIELGLELGYTFLDVYEIWHWEDRQWTDGGERKDLFRKYINTLLKMKVESSGWPSHVKTEQQKKEFIRDYAQKEGIEIDPEQMVFNKGLREIIKLLLNALWGKLCQRVNSTSIQITRSAKEFHELVADPCIEVLDVVHLNEHLDRVVFRKKEEFIEEPGTNNVLMASCVTSHGRRLLYRRIMEAVKLDNCILYCDTDSLFIKRKIGQKTIKEGTFLGEMAKENPDRRIQKIVFAGAKNYAYLHSALDGTDIKLTRKIRGFQITESASKKLTFAAILQQVEQQFNMTSMKKKAISIKYSTFCRTKRGMVYMRPTIKKYQSVYKKGIVQTMREQILPFGHQNN